MGVRDVAGRMRATTRPGCTEPDCLSPTGRLVQPAANHPPGITFPGINHLPRYSGSSAPEPPKSDGMSLNFGRPSFTASVFSP